eukprot:COSAG05_NODE_118_length_17779_cov_4.419231_8_plen_90_part_00
MTDKPVTQYNEHRYPEPTQMQSMLAQVNEILSRVSRIEKEMKEMRATANLIGQDCLEKSMSILSTGAAYEMLPELARQHEYFESDGVKG